MTWRSAAALAAGCLALVWIVSSAGLSAIARDVGLAGWAVPAMAAVHLVQLFLSALAWRQALGGAGLTRGEIFAARWVREGVNSLLPVAQIGGQVAGAGMLVRYRVAPVLAAAGTILDLTLEAGTQLIFTLAGMAVLFGVRGDHAWLHWVGGGVVLTALGVGGFVAAQRLGLFRLLEGVFEHLAAQWPAMSAWSMEGLHARLMARQSDRAALMRGACLHLLSWSLGAFEVWVALSALGHGVSLLDGFVIESLAMAARSAGFAVPGAVGVQEGGFVLVCGLFGVPKEMALALSVLKRVREVAVGAPAILLWQRSSHSAAPSPPAQ
jgi:putative membrane protein